MWVIPEDEAQALELCEGQRPSLLQQIHPSGGWASFAFETRSRQDAAAVWDVRSGRVHWAPPRANVIAWNQSGSEAIVLAVDEPFKRGWLQRYSWPARELLGRAPIRLYGHMFWSARVSPLSGLVAVADNHQGESVISIHRLPNGQSEGDGSGQILRRSAEPHLLEFSPDGAALVWTSNDLGDWWLPEDQQAVGDQDTDGAILPSGGGTFCVGEVCIWDARQGDPRNVNVIDVLVQVARGWRPQESEEGASMVGPVFLDDHRFKIWIPTREWRTYNLEGACVSAGAGDGSASYREAARRSLHAFASQ